jgi:hypothetical protein
MRKEGLSRSTQHDSVRKTRPATRLNSSCGRFLQTLVAICQRYPQGDAPAAAGGRREGTYSAAAGVRGKVRAL